jgi:hypothetical protein
MKTQATVSNKRLQDARHQIPRYGKLINSVKWLQKLHVTSARNQERARLRLIRQLEVELANCEAGLWEADLVQLTLEFWGKPQPTRYPPMAVPKNIEAAKVTALDAYLQRGTAHLERLADEGQREAVELFARHTLHVSSKLSNLRKTSANLLKPVARESIFWPILKSPCIHFDDTHRRPDKIHAQFLDGLEVGKTHPIQGMRWNPSNELSHLVASLFEAVRSWRGDAPIHHYAEVNESRWRKEASRLCDFRPEEQTVGEWIEVMLMVVKEQYPTDAALVRNYGHLVTAPSKMRGIGTIASQLRADIKRRFASMAGLRKDY